MALSVNGKEMDHGWDVAREVVSEKRRENNIFFAQVGEKSSWSDRCCLLRVLKVWKGGKKISREKIGAPLVRAKFGACVVARLLFGP